MNIKEELQQFFASGTKLRFNDIEVNPETIRAIMINEVVPPCPEDDFYDKHEAAYMSTTIPLFRKAGIEVNTVQDILDRGKIRNIVVTNNVVTNKIIISVAFLFVVT